MKSEISRVSRLLGALVCLLFVAAGCGSSDDGDNCDPTCRSGYTCEDGSCVESTGSSGSGGSSCQPECRAGYGCVDGECVEGATSSGDGSSGSSGSSGSGTTSGSSSSGSSGSGSTSGGSGGGHVPDRFVGVWSSVGLSNPGSYDPNSGQFSAPSGTGEVFWVNADGTFDRLHYWQVGGSGYTSSKCSAVFADGPAEVDEQNNTITFRATDATWRYDTYCDNEDVDVSSTDPLTQTYGYTMKPGFELELRREIVDNAYTPEDRPNITVSLRGMTCGRLIKCVGDCGGNQECRDSCRSRTKEAERAKYDALFDCGRQNGCDDAECMRQKCRSEFDACWAGR